MEYNMLSFVVMYPMNQETLSQMIWAENICRKL